MSFKTKIKLWFIGVLTLCVLIGYFLLNMELVQKKIFDVKADVVGSNRTITFYSNIDATKVASFSDKDMRFETEQRRNNNHKSKQNKTKRNTNQSSKKFTNSTK